MAEDAELQALLKTVQDIWLFFICPSFFSVLPELSAGLAPTVFAAFHGYPPRWLPY
jgi:hypothetical protein